MHTYRRAVFSLVIGLVEERMAHRGLAARTIDEETNLIDEGFVDSLEFLDLVATLEERVGVELDLIDAEPRVFTTVGGLVGLLVGAASRARGPSALDGARLR